MTLAKADNSPQVYNPAQLALLFLAPWLLFLCHARAMYVLPVLHLQHLIKMAVLSPPPLCLAWPGLTFGFLKTKI